MITLEKREWLGGRGGGRQVGKEGERWVGRAGGGGGGDTHRPCWSSWCCPLRGGLPAVFSGSPAGPGLWEPRCGSRSAGWELPPSCLLLLGGELSLPFGAGGAGREGGGGGGRKRKGKGEEEEEKEEGRGLVPFSCPFRKCRTTLGVAEDAERLVYLAAGGREGEGRREGSGQDWAGGAAAVQCQEEMRSGETGARGRERGKKRERGGGGK